MLLCYYYVVIYKSGALKSIEQTNMKDFASLVTVHFLCVFLVNIYTQIL